MGNGFVPSTHYFTGNSRLRKCVFFSTHIMLSAPKLFEHKLPGGKIVKRLRKIAKIKMNLGPFFIMVYVSYRPTQKIVPGFCTFTDYLTGS